MLAPREYVRISTDKEKKRQAAVNPLYAVYAGVGWGGFQGSGGARFLDFWVDSQIPLDGRDMWKFMEKNRKTFFSIKITEFPVAEWAKGVSYANAKMQVLMRLHL